MQGRFRRSHLARNRAQISRNLLLGIGFVIGFSALTHLVLDAGVNRLLDLIRVALFTPILIVALVVVYSRLYRRWYPLVCQIGAPVFGIGVTVLAVIAASHGVSLIATVVLVSIYIYFMLGMTFYAAFGAALLVFASYFISAAAVGLPMSVQVIDGGVLIFTNVIGAMVCYTLERATRTNYLEERLLIETDGPYLLPRDLEPKPQSRRNEPMYLPHVLRAIAAARGQSPQELASLTTRNAHTLFGWPAPAAED